MSLLDLFERRVIPASVASEIDRELIGTETVQLDPEQEAESIHFSTKYNISNVDSDCLVLSKGAILLTDDLLLRNVAKENGIEVHGAIGIVTANLWGNKITKNECREILVSLYAESSLYLTQKIYELVLKEIERYRS